MTRPEDTVRALEPDEYGPRYTPEQVAQMNENVGRRLRGLLKMAEDAEPADTVWLVGTASDVSDYVAMIDAAYDRLDAALADAAAVIERMANGASRAECDPELSRVIAALAARGGDV